MNRRAFLAGITVGASAFAGCSGGGDPRDRPTDDPAAPISVRGSWPQFQHDAANTGFASGTSGPRAGDAVAWEFAPDEHMVSTPLLRNGTLFLRSDDRILRLDAETGEEQWTFGERYAAQHPPSVVDGTVFLGVHDVNQGHLFALTDRADDGGTEADRP